MSTTTQHVSTIFGHFFITHLTRSCKKFDSLSLVSRCRWRGPELRPQWPESSRSERLLRPEQEERPDDRLDLVPLESSELPESTASGLSFLLFPLPRRWLRRLEYLSELSGMVLSCPSVHILTSTRKASVAPFTRTTRNLSFCSEEETDCQLTET